MPAEGTSELPSLQSAFFSAYPRNNEAHENRTPNGVRGSSHPVGPRWGADSYWNHHPGVTLAALANPRIISRHASGVAKTAKLETTPLQVLCKEGNVARL